MIVEDDYYITDGLKDILCGYGYTVFCAKNRKEATEILENNGIHLVILDVHLGKDNGYDLCREIREQSEIPVLFLTGCGSEMELIRGFQVGGDDYVTKPFRIQELLVRIQAILRRTAKRTAANRVSGELIYRPDLHQVFKNKKLLELTVVEMKLLVVLMQNWPNAMTRQSLLYQVWDKEEAFVEENTLNVNISRLREKLGTYEGNLYIETVRGIGYRWAVPVKGDRI